MIFFLTFSNSSPLLVAIEKNHVDVVKLLLADERTDVNIKLILNQITIKFIIYFNGIMDFYLKWNFELFFFTQFINQMLI